MGRKIIRLYPAFVLTSCACIALQLFAYSMTGGFVLKLGTNLCGIFLDLALLKSGLFSGSVPLNVPAWFLTPLFVCYLFFWYVFYGNKKALSGKFVAAGALMLAGMAALLNQWDTAMLNIRMGRAFSAFFAGVLLGGYCAYTHRVSLYRILFGLAVVMLSLLMIKVDLSGNLYISAGFMFAALIFALENAGFIELALSKKAVRAIWTPVFNLSYELFLSHYVVLTGIAVLNRMFDIAQYFDAVWFFSCYILFSFLLAAIVKKLEEHMQPLFQNLLACSGDE